MELKSRPMKRLCLSADANDLNVTRRSSTELGPQGECNWATGGSISAQRRGFLNLKIRFLSGGLEWPSAAFLQ